MLNYSILTTVRMFSCKMTKKQIKLPSLGFNQYMQLTPLIKSFPKQRVIHKKIKTSKYDHRPIIAKDN